MNLLSRQTPIASAMAIFLSAFAVIAGAWAYQYAGYLPCDLCTLQRYAYYVGVPLAWVIAVAGVLKAPRAALNAGFLLLAAMFLANFALSLYHSGVEAKYFVGPTACTGAVPASGGGDDLLKQIQEVKVVRCDAPSLRVLGLSLANWNVFLSLALAAMALASALRRGSAGGEFNARPRSRA